MKIDRDKSCPLCGNGDFQNLHDFDEYLILKCNKCGLALTRIKEDIDHSIKEEYHKDYFSDKYGKRYNITGENVTTHKLAKRHKKLLLKIDQYKSSKKHLGKLLDIGCSTGGFLSICNSYGWDTYGVEISSYASNYARERFGLKVLTGDIRDIELPKRSFDVITMLEVIEHIDNPASVLLKVYGLLKDEGILFLTTINEDSLVSYIARFIYYLSLGLIKGPLKDCYQSQHTVHFRKSDIEALLKKIGFVIAYQKKIEIPLSMLEKSKLTKFLVGIIYFLSYLTHLQFEILIIANKFYKYKVEKQKAE